MNVERFVERLLQSAPMVFLLTAGVWCLAIAGGIGLEVAVHVVRSILGDTPTEPLTRIGLGLAGVALLSWSALLHLAQRYRALKAELALERSSRIPENFRFDPDFFFLRERRTGTAHCINCVLEGRAADTALDFDGEFTLAGTKFTRYKCHRCGFAYNDRLRTKDL